MFIGDSQHFAIISHMIIIKGHSEFILKSDPPSTQNVSADKSLMILGLIYM
jgi:hypothetical protein